MTLRPSAFTFLLIAAGGAACGGIGGFATSDMTPTSNPSGSAGATDTDDSGTNGTGMVPSASADAGAAAADSAIGMYKGNPLCLTKYRGTCNPGATNADLAADASTGTANEECVSLLTEPDGGVPYDGGDFACHVVVADGGGASPMCLPAGSSTGECRAQTSCAAGYECVGAGECRRYCCDPQGCDAMSFCDVQPILGAATQIVPVCMPVVPCSLLAPEDTCPGQTCGIVDQTKGVTSCVDIGQAGEGDSCEAEHCAKDLVCLGSIGARKCFTLCDTMSQGTTSACANGQKCLTNGVTFKSGDIGVCGQ